MEAEKIAITLPCEFVWVLTRTYDFKLQDVSIAIRALTSAANVLKAQGLQTELLAVPD